MLNPSSDQRTRVHCSPCCPPTWAAKLVLDGGLPSSGVCVADWPERAQGAPPWLVITWQLTKKEKEKKRRRGIEGGKERKGAEEGRTERKQGMKRKGRREKWREGRKEGTFGNWTKETEQAKQ